MDITRKIGIGITMIVPAFVLGGLLWSWFHSMVVVWLFELVMAGLYVSIITGKLGPVLKDASCRFKGDIGCFGKKQKTAQ